MKKKSLFVLLSALMLTLGACSPSGESSNPASSGGDPASSDPGTSSGGGVSSTPASSDISIPDDLTWTVTFDSQGGSAVAPQTVRHEGRAEEPAAPIYAGYVFQGWFQDTYAVTPFDFSTKITADWTLYAGWKVDLNPVSSEEPITSSEPTPTPSGEYYGPEGSSLVDWYIMGAGALFSGWNAGGGIQLYNNPGNEGDIGCILNVSFAVGDLWKISDGSTWYGYEKISSEGTAASYFTSVGDGFGGQNISVTTAGVCDIYVSGDGTIYANVHAE